MTSLPKVHKGSRNSLHALVCYWTCLLLTRQKHSTVCE